MRHFGICICFVTLALFSMLSLGYSAERQKETAQITPIERMPDGSFRIAKVLCGLFGTCPRDTDVCCHSGVNGGNQFWCCPGGTRECVPVGGCR
jgi:hypothetical protein